MKVLNVETIRNIEDETINSIGIPSIVLMENASQKIIKNINLDEFEKFLIICGKGNNGADGLALAKNLKILGKEVELFLIESDKDFTGDYKINYDILKKLKCKINFLRNEGDLILLSNSLKSSDLTIDALFGLGLNRELSVFYNKIIQLVNKKSKYIISIDIPSGMDGNTGDVMGSCVCANKTITFETYKKGFLTYNDLDYTGEIIVEKIGIPQEVINKYNNNIEIIEKDYIQRKIKKRDIYGYKGDYGKALVIAGNDDYTGAAYITTQATIKSGAGLVTLSTKKTIKDVLSSKLSEAMTSCYDDIKDLEILISKSTVIAIGPGMVNNRSTLECLKTVIKKSKYPLVIDADAINVLVGNEELLKTNSKIIITPHFGEMARLLNKDVSYIKKNRIKVAKEFASKYEIIVVLKGFNTIITDGEKIYVNPTGNSAMASGGMGDCLTGIITSFIAQGYSLIEAAIIATYIHGFAGDILAENMFSVTATDVINLLPKIIKKISNKLE